jgi:alpha-1,2-mannosyltransferase
MVVRSARVGQVLSVVAAALLFGPPIAVGLTGLGAPAWLAAALAAAAGVSIAVFARGVPALPYGAARQHPVLALVLTLAFAVAVVQMTRASVFAHDVTNRAWSVAPSSDFRSQHNCFTAYAEAARFAAQADVNVYDADLYRPGAIPRRMGPLTVDPYHYPPPFLLMPAAVRLVAPEFFDARRVWFAVQVLTLGVTMIALAWWIGGPTGRRVLVSSVAVWALPTTYMALQTGNFQHMALAMALGGAMLAWSSRPWTGAAVLTYAAAAKVFPAMLVVLAVVAGRTPVLRRVLVASVGIAALTAAVFGIDPFVHFVRDEFPRLVSGSSFPQTEMPAGVQVNQSIYGLTTKLRLLGVPALDQANGKRVAQLYALLLAGLVVVGGLRSARPGTLGDEAMRFSHAARWLAVLNLASFASPFVGGAYGAFGTLWLLGLLAAESPAPRRRALWLGAMALMVVVPWFVPSPGPNVVAAPAWLVAGALWQVAAIAVNAWVAWPTRAIAATAPGAIPSSVPRSPAAALPGTS